MKLMPKRHLINAGSACGYNQFRETLRICHPGLCSRAVPSMQRLFKAEKY